MRDIILFTHTSVKTPATSQSDSEETISIAGGLDHNDLGIVPVPDSLSNQQKYQVLSTTPPKLKQYPMNDQKRHFHPYWIEQFP